MSPLPIPPTVRELAATAESFEFSTATPFRYWLRAANAINKQAHSYMADGDDQNAYIFLLRHAILTFERLDAFPEAQSSADLAAAQQVAQANVKLLEEIKPRIDARHRRFTDILAQHQALVQQRRQVAGTASAGFAASAAVTGPSSQPKWTAANLARLGLDRRKEVDPAGSQGLALRLADSARQTPLPTPVATPTPSQGTFNYPTIPRASPAGPPHNPRPAVPAKEPLDLAKHQPPAPPLPPKGTDYTFKTIATTEAGKPLRTVFLPPDLSTEFTRIAAPNTARNVETCAILCGRLISNALFITHLVIPDQTATSDTCDTVNEEALFEYCDNNDLLTIGWIHTHPTQTCFMSSRDLHTHSGYQVQMPESIAIVCAPSKKPTWGIFRLSDPPGLQAVLACTQTGLFHPHSTPNLYSNTLPGGHVSLLAGLKFEVADLRPPVKR